MSDQEIEIVVSPDGEVSVEAFGFTDNSCQTASQDIFDALGVVKDSKPKTNSIRTTSHVKDRNNLHRRN